MYMDWDSGKYPVRPYSIATGTFGGVSHKTPTLGLGRVGSISLHGAERLYSSYR